jgi:hypothetical protein
MDKYILTVKITDSSAQMMRRFGPNQAHLIEDIDRLFDNSRQVETMRLYRLTESGELVHVQTWTRKMVEV